MGQRHIALDGLVNFRDLGGYRAADGRTVRWGRLFRSDNLGKLRGHDEFRALGIRTVVDLRYPWEIARRGRVDESLVATYHNLSIEHRTYDQAGLGPEVDPARYLADRYAEVIEDGQAELRQLLDVIVDEENVPVVFHCAAGKDRTGIVAALILALLGVSDEDIVADFALTSLATEQLLATYLANNPGAVVTWPGYGQAPPELMRLFLAELAQRYGSVGEYVTQTLRLSPGRVEQLRDHSLSRG